MKRIALLTALALPLAADSVPARDDDSKPNRLPRAIEMLNQHVAESPKSHAMLRRELAAYKTHRASGNDEQAQKHLDQMAEQLFDEFRTCSEIMELLKPYVSE